MSISPVAPHPVDLEPSWLRDQTYVSRRLPGRFDAASVLVLTIALVALIPARLVLPGMPGLARPAVTLAVGTVAWWVLVKLNPRLVMTGPQPIRWIVLLLLGDTLVSYAVGFMRGLTTMEVNAADRAMLLIAGMCGLMLLASDGVRNWERLHAVVRAFVWCSAFMAVVGIVQSLFSLDLTSYLAVPGLQTAADAPMLEVRGEAVRAASTATHYIEFSVIMALALPFAIHYGLHSATSAARRTYWAFTALIATAIPLTVSRTGMLCAVVALLVVAPAWNWRQRYNLLMVGLLFGAAATAARPSLVQTIRGLFSGAGNDPSITGRTERYDMAFYYFWQTPWFGRGTGTWVWPQYQFFDNQWLATLMEGGAVGVAVLATLHVCAIVLARIAWRRSKSPTDRHLAAALMSTQVIAILASGTFDSLSFTTYAVMVAILAGLCGALWRLTHPERLVRTAAVSAHDV